MIACAVGLVAAGEGWQVRLDGHDRTTLAAILGQTGEGLLKPGLQLGESAEACDLVIHDGPSRHGTSLLVTRTCYLALRRALNDQLNQQVAGVVVVSEPGRALGTDDIIAVTGRPVITTVPVRADIARTVDAGLLAHRIPDQLVAAARQILQFVLVDCGWEVAS